MGASANGPGSAFPWNLEVDVPGTRTIHAQVCCFLEILTAAAHISNGLGGLVPAEKEQGEQQGRHSHGVSLETLGGRLSVVSS